MLVVPKKYEYTYEPVIALPQTPKNRQIPVKAKMGIMLLIICAFVTGLALTSRVALFTQKGYQITKLKKEIQSLQTANERLKLEIDQLKSLDRIEKIAVNDLGMTEPTVEDMEFVPVQEPVRVAAKADDQQTAVRVSEPRPGILALIAKRISSFFVGMVEASEL
ncbi:cell division protein FtsL [Zhaonella formicivorans]|uniref:cell division protein FtsL n=1 Tax=Zhaonella formicivorans TaxID=2528593 RepID=UPI0010EC7821|nr:cell division protein FtsL [Zhaonella formicivorans]